MKVLVMGGTQCNGRALVWELDRNGHDVTVCNRGKTPAQLPRRVRRLVADRTVAEQVRSVLAKEEFDCVYDISAYQPHDVELMVDILRGRVGHYVFASSTVIYAAGNLLPITENHPVDRTERQTAYGMNKLLCEDILLREHRSNGFPASIVCFSMVFGPHNIIPDREQRMFMRLLKARPVLIPGDGTTVGQVGHVFDQARALRMMMQKPETFGRRYNLTGADAFTDEGYVDTFGRVLGLEPRKVFVPAQVMDDLYAGRIRLGEAAGGDSGSRAAGGDARMQTYMQLQKIVLRVAPNLHHWNRSVFFSIERLRKDIGWEPEYTFPGAVEQTWGWMQAEGLTERLAFDFDVEDRLLERIGGL